jgi:putative ABC transport system permease protein
MLRNHITIALRHLLRNKTYSFINLAGLALAMTCCTFIFLFVENEFSYDRFHDGTGDVFRVVKNFVNEDGTKVPDATTPPALAPALRENLTEVQYCTRFSPARGRLYLLQYRDKRFYETDLISVDTNFFKVFDFQFVSGNKQQSLKDIHSILLTESTAKKYFGDEDPINRVIRMNLNNGTDFVVTGILKDIPNNSHFRFDLMIPFESRRDPDTDWDWSGFYTYVRLKAGTDRAIFESHVKTLIKKYRPFNPDEYYVQSLPDIHLRSKLKWELGINGDLLNVNIMIAIGLIVILIATVNYVNLVTALAARRAKEVAVRKVTGANKYLLIRQFLVESVFTALVALALAIIFTSLCVPYTGSLLGYDLSPLIYESKRLNFVLPGTAVMIGILAGLYPAFYLSSFQPLKALKFPFSKTGGFHLRQALVVFQFVVSTCLMLGSLIVIQQLRFMKQKKLGFDKENILLLPNVRGGIGNAIGPENMVEEMKAIPGVARIARADGVLGYNNSTNGISTIDNRNHIVLNFIRADYDFLPALKIKLKEGRNFSEEYLSDDEAIILNATAVAQLGLKEPYIGRQLAWDDEHGKTHKVSVIGIVEDFHFSSFRDAIKPFGFILEVGNGSTFFLKLNSKDMERSIAAIEKVWSKHYPERPFEYSFLDEHLLRLHQSEARFQKLFAVFTALAIFITCLGMFGLVTFLAEAKTKEIGIRKVLGASVPSIVMLLSKDFVALVIIAIGVSSPLAYNLAQHWLQGFAYRIHIGWEVFAVTGITAIAITLVTVSFESVKAALANPVRSLRND